MIALSIDCNISSDVEMNASRMVRCLACGEVQNSSLSLKYTRLVKTEVSQNIEDLRTLRCT